MYQNIQCCSDLKLVEFPSAFLQTEQYLAVSEVTLTSRYACNRHASDTSVVESSCNCLSQPDTTGQHCEECAAGFQFSSWRRALPDCPFVFQSEYVYRVIGAHWYITLRTHVGRVQWRSWHFIVIIYSTFLYLATHQLLQFSTTTWKCMHVGEFSICYTLCLHCVYITSQQVVAQCSLITCNPLPNWTSKRKSMMCPVSMALHYIHFI